MRSPDLHMVAEPNRKLIKYVQMNQWDPAVVDLTNIERLTLRPLGDQRVISALGSSQVLPRCELEMDVYEYKRNTWRVLDQFIEVRARQIKQIEIVVLDYPRHLIRVLTRANLVLDFAEIMFYKSCALDLSVNDVRALLRLSVHGPLLVQTDEGEHFAKILKDAIKTEPNKKCRIGHHM